MSFWNSDKMLEATSGELIGLEFTCGDVNTDTRSIKSGELFIALIGDNFDGHDYLQKAVDSGASGALVSNIPADAPDGFALIVVKDTLRALQSMAKYRRKHTSAKIVAITGSVGKTSAKEMLKIALSEYGKTYATSGNYNNHIGLPICLCNLPESSEYAIFEMGMNHADEICFLSLIAKPDVALITNVEAVHLEFFDSVTAIAYAKAEIFDGMENAIAVLPSDNKYFDILENAAIARDCETISFGESKGSTLRLTSSAVEYEFKGESRSFKLDTLGAHWSKAALGVLGCVAALNITLDKAEKSLVKYHEQTGRGEVVTIAWQGGKITLMDDAYNASPVSMAGALVTLATLGQGRKLAILGDMLELGKSSKQLHANLAGVIAEQNIDAVITIGEQMQYLANVLSSDVHVAHFAEVESANNKIETLVKPGDIVLCKGSHGSGVYHLVKALKK